eukprot:TRINITY_DN4708_c0_g1_i1.p1 TRINITY_DN4708_c0_g1~~TRINITY_DN4708_c0_g1_i1.p1  ORF type:complete len:422 (-),score=61.66 TRINITY_DN4708_c0_g1_i1:119-1384(-)
MGEPLFDHHALSQILIPEDSRVDIRFPFDLAKEKIDPHPDLALEQHPHLTNISSNHYVDTSENELEQDYSKVSIHNLIGMEEGKDQLEMISTNNLTNGETLMIDGVVYNNRGYEVCGHLNQHSKPCQRIGRCPFHGSKKDNNMLLCNPIPLIEKKDKHLPPIKKSPYKQGWTKDEHMRFLNGLQLHGKGAWKEISSIVRTRSPTQIQSHAQKYYLRQKQEIRNKRSIHDISLNDMLENQDLNGTNSLGSSNKSRNSSQYLQPVTPNSQSSLGDLQAIPSMGLNMQPYSTDFGFMMAQNNGQLPQLLPNGGLTWFSGSPSSPPGGVSFYSPSQVNVGGNLSLPPPMQNFTPGMSMPMSMGLGFGMGFGMGLNPSSLSFPLNSLIGVNNQAGSPEDVTPNFDGQLPDFDSSFRMDDPMRGHYN